jgi:HTH-type transcriptional regulator/antitoxin MqsA
MTRACPICGQIMKQHTGTYTYVWPEGSSLAESHFDNADWETCEQCDEEYLSGELVSRIEAQRYVVDGLLTPAEIKAVRERVGLSQVAMAKRLGVGEKTYARWETGLCVQNRSMDNLIRIADQDPDIFLRIEASRDPAWSQAVSQYVAMLGSSQPQSKLAFAAHGEQPQVANAAVIRAKLRAILASRDVEK